VTEDFESSAMSFLRCFRWCWQNSHLWNHEKMEDVGGIAVGSGSAFCWADGLCQNILAPRNHCQTNSTNHIPKTNDFEAGQILLTGKRLITFSIFRKSD
jgi:hypothetical protein